MGENSCCNISVNPQVHFINCRYITIGMSALSSETRAAQSRTPLTGAHVTFPPTKRHTLLSELILQGDRVTVRGRVDVVQRL